MKCYVMHRDVTVARPLDEVFAFFADPANLARITPPWLAFEMVGWEEPGDTAGATAGPARGVQGDGSAAVPKDAPVRQPRMRRGLLLHYRVRPLLVPQRWTSEITEWDPPRRFTDEQVHGPYRLWRHTHTFEPIEGGTRVRDRVEYALPFGPFGRLAHLLLVQHQLRRIFAFRHEAMNRIFGLDQGTETS